MNALEEKQMQSEERAMLGAALPVIDDALAPLVAAGLVEWDDALTIQRILCLAAARCGVPAPTTQLPRVRKAVSLMMKPAPVLDEVL